MRRLPTLLLALSLLSAAVLTGAALLIPASGDQVAYTETVLAGDPAAARGLTVHLPLRAATAGDDTLRWDVTYTFGATPVLSTRLSMKPIPSEPRCELHLHTGIALPLSDESPDRWQGTLSGLDLAFLQLYLDTPPAEGETVSRTVPLADYYDHYPISPSVTYLGGDFFYARYPRGSQDGDAWSEAFRDSFSLPVPHSARYTISIQRHVTPEGYTGDPPLSYSFQKEGGHSAYLTAAQAFDHQAIYFSPNLHEVLGEEVDVGRIPMGWGVYRLPYRLEDQVFHPDEPSLFYGLEPSQEVADLRLTDDGRGLHLVIRDDTGLTYLRLDTDTGEELLRFPLTDDPEIRLELFFHDHFVATVTSSTAVTLFAPDEGGRWAKRLTADFLSLSVPRSPFTSFPIYVPHQSAMAWDGERLAVVTQGYLPEEELTGVKGGYLRDCGFELAVYDNTGLLYLGHYDSDLDRYAVAPQATYLDGQSIGLHWH